MKSIKKHINFLALSAAAILPVIHAAYSAAADHKPNIIVIVAEDAAASSVPVKDAASPNIDALAKTGIRFAGGYSVSSQPGPGDAALLTGQYPQRFGFDANADAAATPADHGPRGLDSAQPTLAQDLKSAGYATGAFGSWNLGSADGYQPAQRGFDESDVSDQASVASKASAFIDHHAAAAFFLYLPVNGAAANDVLGNVTASLRDHQLDENALIVFANNKHLAHWSLSERGIKAPFILNWKGAISSGQTIDQPLSQLDVAPTVLAAAGIEANPALHLDGSNLLPFLQGQSKVLPDEILYWRLGVQYAVRQGDWKLAKVSAEGHPQLFYLESPVLADIDLFKQQGNQAKSLQALWDAWNAGNQPPRWADDRWNGQSSDESSSNDTTFASARSAGPWKSGDSLTTKQAPNIAGKALEISAEVDLSGANGIVITQGGAANGYAIYLTGGKPAFAVREDGELTVIDSKDSLDHGHFTIAASLQNDGGLTLSVNGKPVAQGKTQGAIQRQPKAGLRIGDSGNGSVGDYPVPYTFEGKVSNVRVNLR